MKLRDAAALEEHARSSRARSAWWWTAATPPSAATFFRDEEVAQRENLHIVREHWDMGGAGQPTT